MLSREWGDGATDTRVHVIEDISYALTCIECRCGQRLDAESNEALGRSWRAHIGGVTVGQEAVDARWPERATDEEVTEFLVKVAREESDDDAGRRVRRRALSTRAMRRQADPLPDVDEGMLLLARFAEMRAACTCDVAPVTECPNYIEGDEALDTDDMLVAGGDR